MFNHISLKFRWIRGTDVTREVLDECSKLYSNHYGIWSDEGNDRPRERIKLTPKRLREFLISNDSWAALAYHNDELIAYAFAIHSRGKDSQQISWVTQLVVHSEYRNRDVAKRLLSALWGFSDQMAWGLVTSNPYAVRALEKATRRRCDPIVIKKFVDVIRKFGNEHIVYIRGKQIEVTDSQSVINTEFYVDHKELPAMLHEATKTDPWKLGELREGHEWFAFVLREQPEIVWTAEELQQVLQDAERIVSQAYERMSLSQHKWNRNTIHEIDFIISQLHSQKIARIADFGCGTGRHVIELASRGYRATGIDFVSSYINFARDEARELPLAQFELGDCRDYKTSASQDVILCLYDVIGSFPDEASNDAIIANIAHNLKSGGYIVASVMNMELTEHIAKYTTDVMNNPRELTKLPPSNTMQATGGVFDPDYYLLDLSSSLVYRKEQFDNDQYLPAELIVRDRRYRRQEVLQKFVNVGIEPIDCYYVQSGHWDRPLDPTDIRAKEILFIGRKL